MYLMGAHTCPARVIRLPARTHDALTFAHRKQLFACVFHALLCLKTCRKGYRQGIREDRIAFFFAVNACDGLTAKKFYTTSRFFCYTHLPQKKIHELQHTPLSSLLHPACARRPPTPTLEMVAKLRGGRGYPHPVCTMCFGPTAVPMVSLYGPSLCLPLHRENCAQPMLHR